MLDRDRYSIQIEKILTSHTLRGSESLCKLLRYLAKHALDEPGVHLKEYQIATEVFGRQTDFDPQLDSTIRVQAGRLRLKLTEYYGSEGAEDPVLVELPKGAYVVSFHHRALAAAKPNGHGLREGQPAETSANQALQKSTIAIIALSIVLAVSLITIAALVKSHKTSDAALGAIEQPAPHAFELFWKPFLTWPEEPAVVFSNAAFIGRPETGMRYYDPARDSHDLIWDHYTGVGEVFAVHNLDGVFSLFHRSIRVKRGSLFSLDDAKNNDLIFVGSPSENLTLMDIPGTKEFIFQRLDSGPRKGDLAIVNVHPQPGEAKAYLASPSNTALTEEYAVVGLLEGLNPERPLIILAGTTTFGTQGAVEYVCRQESVEELLKRLGVSGKDQLKPFEALLHVKITRGVPVETTLVAVKKRTP
jgi:hypothetical protein